MEVKLSNEIIYTMIFEKGLSPPLDTEYQNDKLKEAVKELNEIRDREKNILNDILYLLSIRYGIFIYTNNDYIIKINDNIINVRGTLYFNSIEELRHALNNISIISLSSINNEKWIKTIFNDGLKSMENGNKDFLHSSNHEIYFFRII